MTLLAIDSIQVGERYRRDMGDMDALVASIAAVGLLHPVVVMEQDGKVVLVAGERRLRACQRLGMERIPIRMLPGGVDLLQAESDENAVREPFTPSEAAAIAKALRPIEEAAAKDRQGERSDVTGEPPAIVGRSADRIARAVGMGRTTLAKAEAVVDAAATNPVLAPIVEAMDATGNVAGAHRAVVALIEPTPEEAQAAAESLRVRRRAEERIAQDPDVQAAARAARLAKAIQRHGEAQYALAAEHWSEGLDRSDIQALRGHLVAARRWIEAWERALEEHQPLRVVGGSK